MVNSNDKKTKETRPSADRVIGAAPPPRRSGPHDPVEAVSAAGVTLAPGPREAALRLDIIGLESDVAKLAADLAGQKATVLALEHLRVSLTEERDAARTAAAAGAAEVKRLTAACDALRRERDAARIESESGHALAEKRQATYAARVAELEDANTSLAQELDGARSDLEAARATALEQQAFYLARISTLATKVAAIECTRSPCTEENRAGPAVPAVGVD